MHRHEARIAWARGDAKFSDNRYSRGHEWSFDGGVTVPASSSPSVVPFPYSVAAAVDPEEALVASAASCHMLWFLSLAARKGYVVDHYEDEAYGIVEKDAHGREAFTRVTLRPRITFRGAAAPTPAELEELHHAAHDACFIANTLKCDVVVEGG